MLGIGKEAAIFIHAGLAGIIVVLTYLCIRIVRRLVNHNWLAVTIEDFLFWIWTSLFLFVQIYHTSNGTIRWYFVLGVVFGMIIANFIKVIMKKIHKKIYTKKNPRREEKC